MRRTLGALLILALALLASLPWLLMATRPQPLLPEDLRLARAHYEATVEAAQDGTIAAGRQATSVPNIRVIGTVAGGPTTEPQPEPASLTPGATLETIVIVIQSTLPVTEPPPVILLTPQADATEPALPTGNPSPGGEASPAGPSDPTAASPGPPTPANLVAIEDRITEAQLADQIRLDADNGLPDLSLTITPEGIRAASAVTLFPGITQRIEAGGVLSIQDNNLVFQTEFVRLNGDDVSALYGDRLESQINTTLYRLLPGRFVRSYELGLGEIRVQSGVRP